MRDELFIDGEWQTPAAGGTFEVENPATGELLHRAPAGTAPDVDRAVRRRPAGPSRAAGGRRAAPTAAAFLRAIADRISARREELARLEVLDNGKPLPEALWDIDDAAGCFSMYADLAEELDGRQERPLPLPDARFSSQVRLEPVGVAGQIIPWNYPLLMAAWKVAPALAAGATVVLKPSELTPLTALELAAIAEEVGLPPGVLNVVSGTGREAGEPLALHPLGRQARLHRLGADRPARDDGGGAGDQERLARARRQVAVHRLRRRRRRGGGRVGDVRHLLEPGPGLQRDLAAAGRGAPRAASARSALRGGEEDPDRRRARRRARSSGPLVSRGQHEKVLGFIDRARAEKLTLRDRRRPPAGTRTRLFPRADDLRRCAGRVGALAGGGLRAGARRAHLPRRGGGGAARQRHAGSDSPRRSCPPTSSAAAGSPGDSAPASSGSTARSRPSARRRGAA